MTVTHRSGVLPEALALPIEEWSRHPRFPQQTLLLNSHESFRRTGAVLVDRARRGADAPGIGWVFRAWKGAMKNHERYEEYKLYPYLEVRWGLSMEPAEAGHRELAELDQAVREAVRSGPASAELADALERHHQVLLAHLELEESLVIPALLALTPAEFEEYSVSDIRGLLERLEG